MIYKSGGGNQKQTGSQSDYRKPLQKEVYQ
jgi:hypothetical protein